MPHDRNGKRVEVGAEVIVRARVTRVDAGEEFCNVTMETHERMFPGESKSTIVLNAKQVELVES